MNYELDEGSRSKGVRHWLCCVSDSDHHRDKVVTCVSPVGGQQSSPQTSSQTEQQQASVATWWNIIKHTKT